MATRPVAENPPPAARPAAKAPRHPAGRDQSDAPGRSRGPRPRPWWIPRARRRDAHAASRPRTWPCPWPRAAGDTCSRAGGCQAGPGRWLECRGRGFLSHARPAGLKVRPRRASAAGQAEPAWQATAAYWCPACAGATSPVNAAYLSLPYQAWRQVSGCRAPRQHPAWTRSGRDGGGLAGEAPESVTRCRPTR